MDEGVRVGFQRGLRVAWVARPVGERLWQDGPDALGIEVARALERLGLTEPWIEKHDQPISRNLIFADAMCDDTGIVALDRLASSPLVIAGCGGLGSVIATMLAAMGARSLYLLDGDRIEATNLNRLLWSSEADVGRFKADALAEHLLQRFGVDAIPIPRFVGAASRADVGRCGAREDAFWILTVDDAHSARMMTAAHWAKSRMLGAFPTIVHAGYVGRHCVVGPLATALDDACPFCAQQAITFAARSYVAASAAPNNHLIAGFVCSQLLRAMSGRRTTIAGTRWCLDLVHGAANLTPIAKDPRCQVCSSN